MIKVFLLILMMHAPNMPTVKYQAYVLPTLEECENARIVRENLAHHMAKQRDIDVIWIKSACIEMDVFTQEI